MEGNNHQLVENWNPRGNTSQLRSSLEKVRWQNTCSAVTVQTEFRSVTVRIVATKIDPVHVFCFPYDIKLIYTRSWCTQAQNGIMTVRETLLVL